MSEVSQPLVGIALAAYKPPIDYFEAQLDSIAKQTYQNWFCVVGFDSNKDDVLGHPSLKKFVEDPRFEFRQNSGPPGAAENFQATALRCLEKNPRYISFSDQDDIWQLEKTARLVSEIAKYPAMSVVHCDMHILMKEGDTFQTLPETAWQKERRGVHNNTPLDFMVRNMAAGAGMVMDAELVRRYPKVPAGAFSHDHWYVLVASFFGGVHPLNVPLYSYRIHGANIAGISEYQGFFSASKSSRATGAVQRCLQNFNTSRMRYRHAAAVGLPVSLIQWMVTSSFVDFGIGYFVKALTVIGADRALARACLARAAGKVFRLFQPTNSDYSAM